MAGRIQSIVQEARHTDTEISIGEMFAKDRAGSAGIIFKSPVGYQTLTEQ